MKLNLNKKSNMISLYKIIRFQNLLTHICNIFQMCLVKYTYNKIYACVFFFLFEHGANVLAKDYFIINKKLNFEKKKFFFSF